MAPGLVKLEKQHLKQFLICSPNEEEELECFGTTPCVFSRAFKREGKRF